MCLKIAITALSFQRQYFLRLLHNPSSEIQTGVAHQKPCYKSIRPSGWRVEEDKELLVAVLRRGQQHMEV
nr:hypothetical protein [Oxalobacteraceae bacterium]